MKELTSKNKALWRISNPKRANYKKLSMISNVFTRVKNTKIIDLENYKLRKRMESLNFMGSAID